jgi:ParB family transcriptional regulator, chromosome partitioning protein
MSFEYSSFQELLPLHIIHPAKIQTRSFDSEQQIYSIRELALSIKTHGLLQPIVVRPMENGFEIAAGHRRFLACKLLRWKKIPVCIQELSDKESLEVQIIENIQRCSLNCIEEGISFSLYVKDYGWGGVTDLAFKINKSEQYVSSRIQLLSLPKNIQQNIIDGKVNVSQALELVSLNEKDRNNVVDKILNDNLPVKKIIEIKQDSNNKSIDTSNVNNIIDNSITFKKDLEDIEKETKLIGSEIDIYNPIDEVKYINRQKLLLLKKVKLCFKISLSKMDNLIHEYEDIGNKDNELKDDLKTDLLKFRIELHSLLDDDIKLISQFKKHAEL